MAYSILEQISRDIDFFIQDKGKLAHFASAGGRLPRIIEEDDVTNEAVASNIWDLIQSNLLNIEIEINPNINEIAGLNSESEREYYLRDFVAMAKSGIYSYDKSVLGEFSDTKYHLVAKPKRPFIHCLDKRIMIELELPLEWEIFDLSKYIEFNDGN